MIPSVYISSPYTEGDQVANAGSAIYTMKLLQEGGIVFAQTPLAMFAAQLQLRWSHAQWMAYDLAWLERYDAMLVVGERGMVARSKGVQIEIAFALAHGIPVFYSIGTLYEWVEKRSRVCKNCEHFDDDIGVFPCSECIHPCSNWEAKK